MLKNVMDRDDKQNSQSTRKIGDNSSANTCISANHECNSGMDDFSDEVSLPETLQKETCFYQ